MKRSIIFIIGLLVASWVLAQEDVKEQFTIPLTDPNERAKIELSHINGDITIISYSGKEVIITATASGKSMVKFDCDDCDDDENNAPPGMKRINTNSMELRATENNNVVDINTESWKRRINVEVKAPVNCDLELHTVHGDILVTGINGAMDVSSVNGKINMQNVSGSVLANTVNGEVLVTFKSVTTGEPMSFVTLNGNVDVTLPANTKATTKMKSDRGEVFTDFDMVLERSKKDVKKQSGQYEVSINAWVYGKINGGGAEYTMKNMHGNIIVRKGN